MNDPQRPPVPGDFTMLLRAAADGNVGAAEHLLPLVYGELRKLAAAKMAHEAPGQTLQPTALVHEAWLRLGGDLQPTWENRAHFFGAAAESMRRILIENARKRRAAKYGGGLQKLSANVTGFDVAVPQLDDEQLLELDEALGRLAAHDARKAELVKLHFFVGLTLDEAAKVLKVVPRTAHRDWAYARAWLFNDLKSGRT